MKWMVPSKTFLLGEYAAVAEQSAIVITTTPCFELSLSSKKTPSPIHPESPAGRWWQSLTGDLSWLQATRLRWSDPYQGLGGLGASSAQFLACYLAASHLQHKIPTLEELLLAYYQVASAEKGLRPSGYDLIAQTRGGCVFINRSQKIIEAFDWPFHDLSFFLIHTGKKLATHEHLKETTLPDGIDNLSAIVDEAKTAFLESKSEQLISTINQYHLKLVEMEKVALHSLELIKRLSSIPEILAIKGCGAMGSDVILVLSSREHKLILNKKLLEQSHQILATESDLNLVGCKL